MAQTFGAEGFVPRGLIEIVVIALAGSVALACSERVLQINGQAATGGQSSGADRAGAGGSAQAGAGGGGDHQAGAGGSGQAGTGDGPGQAGAGGGGQAGTGDDPGQAGAGGGGQAGACGALTTGPLDRKLVALIHVTRSTNSSAIAVTVFDDASAERSVAATSIAGRDPPAKSYPAGSPEVATFLCDLTAAGPVSAIPTVMCPKSVSFGTFTTITDGDQTSGDLQCLAGASAAAVALAHDCDVLTGRRN
jgi:hypothetical protein